MRRLLSLLLALTGLVLVAPPAHAVLSVTISASRTTLPHGSSVTFSGRAVDAKPGSVVRLQRKAPTGWRTVASKKVWAPRSYRFSTTPPKGYQYYRVLKPRQLGQAAAVSRTVKLTVRWRPSVILGEVSHEVDANTDAVTTTAGGRTTGLAAGTGLRREVQQADGTWARHGWTTIAADRSWSDTFAGSHGMRLRYTVPASGPRLESSSTSFVVDGRWTPTLTVAATMDAQTDEVTVDGSSTGLPEGATVQREYSNGDSWVAEGAPVPVAAAGAFSDSFQVTMHRDYRYTVSAAGLRQEASSTPFAFTDTPVTRVSLNSTTNVVFPAGGAVRTLLLHLDEGQVFTLHSAVPQWTWSTVTDPSGGAVPGFGPTHANVTATAPMSGDYTIRFERPDDATKDPATSQITFSAPVVARTALEGTGVDLRSTWPGQVVDLRFSAEGGSLISEYAVPQEAQPGYARGVATLLAPSGEVVPNFGSLARQGGNWRLPSSGDYTLRFTPSGADRVDRLGQSVLLGQEVSVTLDGAPGHLSLDRPGRVGWVSVTVPAGLRVDFLHNAEPRDVYPETEYFHPDGSPFRVHSSIRHIEPTEAGTYTALVSAVDVTAEFDFYALTPARYDAEVGSTVAYDQGPALGRQARIRIPVTAGQVFGFDGLDDTGEACTGTAYVKSGRETLEWATDPDSYPHPQLFKVARDGELVLAVTPCSLTGTFRLKSTTIVPSTVTGSTTDESGSVTTAEATLRVRDPGQVMILEYDAGPTTRNSIQLGVTRSTFRPETRFWVSHVPAGGPTADFLAAGTADDLRYMQLSGASGKTYFFFYAGLDATGTIDLEMTRRNY
jgi:hypothetical protein